MDSNHPLYKESLPAGAVATGPRLPAPPAWQEVPGPGSWTPRRVWRLKPNCALSPRQFMLGVGGPMAASACVALCCALRGLWLVPVFCAVELLAVAAAVLAYARHAVDGEIVTLASDGCVRVQQDRGLRRTSHVFQLSALRLVHPDADPTALWLHEGGRELRLGEHASSGQRAAFEAELRSHMRDR